VLIWFVKVRQLFINS